MPAARSLPNSVRLWRTVIASQFTEATDDLYLQALIELGLVLFALTIIINGAAQLLILTTGPRLERS